MAKSSFLFNYAKREVYMDQGETSDYWLELLKKWKNSGVGLKKWCEQNGHKYYQTRYQLRKLLDQNTSADFVEVTDQDHLTGQICLIVGGVQVQLTKNFDPVLLQQVVSVLREVQC